MGRYFKCSFCPRIVELVYGATTAQCPGCGAVYSLTDVPSSTGGLFSTSGHSGEGWWGLGGFILGLAIGWPISRAVLQSAIGLTADEIQRRAREVASRAEAKARELAATAQARIEARRRS
jgi:hypothetical protein